MPKGPRGEKRPGDVIGVVIMVAKIGAGGDRGCPEADAQDLPQPGGAQPDRSDIAARGMRDSLYIITYTL
jgi:hypothetical protein